MKNDQIIKSICMLFIIINLMLINACKKEEINPEVSIPENYLVPLENAIEKARIFSLDHSTENFEVLDTYSIKDSAGTPAIHVINYQEESDSNFVIYAADSRIPYHLGFGKGLFEQEKIVEGISVWINWQISLVEHLRTYEVSYEEFVEIYLEGNLSPFETVDPCANSNYILSAIPEYDPVNGYTGLLDTKWGQGCAYNARLSACNGNDYNCNRYVTGCVATAMAQIMKYHQYPAHSFLGQPFEWPTMLDRYIEGSYTTEQQDAVSYLMMICGAYVDMDYGCERSGAQTCDIADALEDMGYSDDIDCGDGLSILTIMGSISQNHPVVLRGTDSRGGHAWIGDGFMFYQYCQVLEKGSVLTNPVYPPEDLVVDYTRPYVHMNWGWDGDKNGYFTLNSFANYLYPPQFNENVRTIYNIYPE